MIFTSKKYKTARYVIEPRDITVAANGVKHKVIGLAAVFHNYTFDSVATARVMKWSPDQRMVVECELLRHPDCFRRFAGLQSSIWLGSWGTPVNVDMDIPDELEAFDPGLRAEVQEKLESIGYAGGDAPAGQKRCIEIILTGEGERQCKMDAKVGVYCTKHANMKNPEMSADELKAEIEAELLEVG